jgi:hypothetical protein
VIGTTNNGNGRDRINVEGASGPHNNSYIMIIGGNNDDNIFVNEINNMWIIADSGSFSYPLQPNGFFSFTAQSSSQVVSTSVHLLDGNDHIYARAVPSPSSSIIAIGGRADDTFDCHDAAFLVVYGDIAMIEMTLPLIMNDSAWRITPLTDALVDGHDIIHLESTIVSTIVSIGGLGNDRIDVYCHDRCDSYIVGDLHTGNTYHTRSVFIFVDL